MIFLHGNLKSSQNNNHGIQLDFFFTARGTEMQRTPLGMFRSLLNQIFDRDATIRPQVRDAYEQRSRLFGRDKGKWEWAQPILEELLASVILASASRQHMTLFVDALDEAGAESAQRLAAYFHRLIDRAKQKDLTVLICISYRHYPIVESDQTVEIHIEQHNHKDIATYITNTLAKADIKENLSEEIKEVLIKQLIQQANGVFQWARLIVPIFQRKISEAESFDEICRWLHGVPADLEDMYMCILNDVIEAHNLEQSFLLFQWVCLAERPLTLVEMRYALAANNAQITRATKKWENIDGFIESDKRMKGRIQPLSGGLAEVVPSRHSTETVQVVHQSVNDFLRVKGLAALSDKIGASSEVLKREEIFSRCQANLYRSCLLYLALHRVREDIPNDDDHQETEKDLIPIQNYPLFAYATFNLFIHAEKAAHFRVLKLPDEQGILQQVIGQWTRIYRILNYSSSSRPSRNTTIIHMAAAANLVDIIERLPLNSEDVARKDEDGNTPLHLAARYGHTSAGRCLCEKAANADEKNMDGTTPLIEAASYGHTGFVEWLIFEGVKLEITMGGGASALQVAARKGNLKIVEILIVAGADVNAQGDEHGNALQAAAAGYGGSSELVRMLLDAGADVNAQGGKHGNALQAAAASNKNNKIVQLLLDAGADVDALGGEHGNALQAAAAGYGGTSEIVQMLLDAGADVNAQGGEHGNALQAASGYGGTSEIVQMLLDAGADVNAQGGEHGNALQAAAASNRNSGIVQMLLDAGADVNALGGEHGNALQAAAAAYNGNSEILQMLLDAGADVSVHAGKYGNALQAAAAATHNRSSEIIQVLLDAGVDVNTKGGKYGNSLQAAAAARHGSSEIVKMLLDAGAEINAQGGEYGNALQAAVCACRGNNEIVNMLLNAGANVNSRGGRYGPSLLASVLRGHVDQVQILLHAGANVLLVDELDQTPLHIAASENRLDLLRQFPELLSPINNRDKLSRTPLQLAITLGHIEFATYLLQFGANPSLLDGYGRSILDWAIGNEILVRKIRGYCPSIVVTPHNAQELVVRQSILQISDTLLQSQLRCPWPLLQQLGRYLLFVNELDNAQCLFQLHMSQKPSDGNFGYADYCGKCKKQIFLPHFVCRTCAYMDLCSRCVQKYPFHSRLHPNQEHETIEVPCVRDRKYLLSASASEKLRNVVDKFSAPEARGSSERPSHDFMTCLPSEVIAPGSTAAIPTAPLRPISMFRFLMFGLIPLLLIYLYSLV
ncbi:unnamed protein product [Penicillium salamii]|uniref:Nephrocystin 3-like N-terminal domain-containing protein n=1 Tax=Penicillium salamii TaxID=1612424 RepID=A0A9W4N1C0_9EURO|nr:unnamed protein product [Penicillium salamii]